jgi:Acetokinase family
MTHIMLARNRNRPPMFEAEMKILVCNAGSSSLKFSLFEADEELLLAEGGVDWSRKPTRLVFRRTGEEELCEELQSGWFVHQPAPWRRKCPARFLTNTRLK